MKIFESKKEKSMRIVRGLLYALDLNVREFADSINFGYMQVYYVLTGKTKTISSDFVEATLAKYPEVRREYLIDGTGPVFVQPNGEEEDDDDSSNDIFERPEPVESTEMIRLMNRVMDYLDNVQTREQKITELIERTLTIEEKLADRLISLSSQNKENQ